MQFKLFAEHAHSQFNCGSYRHAHTLITMHAVTVDETWGLA